MAETRTITLTAESYAEAVGNLLALRQLAHELSEVFADLADWGRGEEATRRGQGDGRRDRPRPEGSGLRRLVEP